MNIGAANAHEQFYRLKLYFDTVVKIVILASCYATPLEALIFLLAFFKYVVGL